MTPTTYLFLDKLPTTTTGKIDRTQLIEKYHNNNNNKEKIILAETKTEKLLIDIWSEILGIKKKEIGTEANFFDLGGHSLLATQVINKINHLCKCNISIRDFFTSPTIKKLSALVDHYKASRPDETLSPIKSHESKQNTLQTLSLTQQRRWLTSTNTLDNDSKCNMPSALRLQGKLNTAYLHQSFCTLSKRHDCLRTTFKYINGNLFQKILKKVSISIQVKSIDENDLEQTLTELTTAAIDITHAPLFKIYLLKLTNIDHILVFNIHHLICDGWSLGILYRELSQTYHSLINNTTKPLPKVEFTYTDFIKWQQKQPLVTNREYWKDQLSNATLTCHFSKNRELSRPEEKNLFNTQTFKLPNDLSKNLYQVSRQKNITLFTTLITGFNLLLSHHSKQNDICVLFDEANRQKQEFSPIVGLFTNTLILRTRMNTSAGIDDLLQSTKHTLLSAIEHQNISYDELSTIAQKDRPVNLDPLCNTAFSIQSNPNQYLKLPMIKTSPITLTGIPAKVDLSLWIVESEKKLIGKINYNKKLFNDLFIQDFFNDYISLLTNFTNTPEITIDNLLIKLGTAR